MFEMLMQLQEIEYLTQKRASFVAKSNFNNVKTKV